VPFRNLPKLHRALRDAGYLEGAHVWPSYRSLWRALTLRKL
jgi:fatty acid desaturase